PTRPRLPFGRHAAAAVVVASVPLAQSATIAPVRGRHDVGGRCLGTPKRSTNPAYPARMVTLGEPSSRAPPIGTSAVARPCCLDDHPGSTT
ncbi:hypothetical protein, partial [Jiangella rhizosphaerae]|uniref:hypothetical protein n=1 Tax=Jiangella rhizosphaerae TaxID=2293569 RepID=UPI001F3025DB